MSALRFLAPDYSRPSGGMRRIYRYVDLLCEEGLDAAVVHRSPGFRCTWFANSTRVMSLPETRVGGGDLLVLPEEYLHLVPRLAPGVAKLLLNQNVYFMFRGAGFAGPYAQDALCHPDLLGSVVMSDDALRFHRRLVPALPCTRMHLGIDETVWFDPGGARQPNRIVLMPRRRIAEAETVVQCLRHGGALDGWEVVIIDDLPEAQAAELVRGARIFLSFSEREGFGLPPAEAMASGVVVVGYAGLGGTEYFDPSYCFPVPEGQVQQYVETVEHVLRLAERQPDVLDEMRDAARTAITTRYTRERERAELLTVIDAATTAATARRAGVPHTQLRQADVPRLVDPVWRRLWRRVSAPTARR